MVVALVLAVLSFAQPEAGAQDYPSYPSSPVYECPPDLGYVMAGSGVDTTCTRVMPATPVGDGTYTCPAEYKSAGTGVSTTCTLVIVFTDTVEVPAYTYSCPASYTSSGSGAAKICIRTVPATETTANIANGDGTYSCPAGYSSNGSGASKTCSRTIAVRESTGTIATATGTVPGCPSSQWFSVGQGTGKFCVRPLTAPEVNALASSYPSGPNVGGICPEGFSTSGSGLSTACTQILPATLGADGTYSCPIDYVSLGGGATKTCTLVIVFEALDATSGPTTYSCPAGYASDGSGAAKTCTRTIQVPESTAVIMNGDGTYSCPAGYVSDGTGPTKTCSRTVPATESTGSIATPAASTYSCPAGYISIGSGPTKLCARALNTDEVAALYAPAVTTGCPSGFTLVNNTCTQTVVDDQSTVVVVVPAPVRAAPAVVVQAPAPALVAAPVVAAPAVAVAANYGFGTSLPATHAATTSPALAHTGASSELLAYAGLALLASGAVFMGSRRRIDAEL